MDVSLIAVSRMLSTLPLLLSSLSGGPRSIPPVADRWLGLAQPAACVAARGPGEGDAEACSPDQSAVATASGSLSPTGTVSDPNGDLEALYWVFPHPDWARGLTIDGNRATILVPSWLIDNPDAFYWHGTSEQPSTNFTLLDVAPDGPRVHWTAGGTSSTNDLVDASLQPLYDITFLGVSQADANHIQFDRRCRGNFPSGEADVIYWFNLAYNPTSELGDWWVGLWPEPSGWYWEVDTSSTSNVSFPWRSASYEDIVSARATDLGNGQVRFEITTADNIPATPASGEGEPWFVWRLDIDNNRSTGYEGADRDLTVRYRATAPMGWEGMVRRWNGAEFVDLMYAPFTRSGNTVSASVNISELGLAPTFSWFTQVYVVGGPAMEQFAGRPDRAPDSGWAEIRLGQAHSVYLPLVHKQHRTAPVSGWRTIKTEDFEGEFPGAWSLWVGQSTAHWGKRDCRATSGSSSGWAVGGGGGAALDCGSDYPDNVTTWMIYGPFSLADATAADVTLQLWLSTGSDRDDFFFVGASTDGDNFSGSTASGDSHGWMPLGLDLADVYSLGDLTGRPSVWIGLRFFSDASVRFPEGAHVDDIVLRKYVSAIGQRPPAAAGDGAHTMVPGGITIGQSQAAVPR